MQLLLIAYCKIIFTIILIIIFLHADLYKRLVMHPTLPLFIQCSRLPIREVEMALKFRYI